MKTLPQVHYLIFERFEHHISKEMKFNLRTITISDDHKLFTEMINYLCESSKYYKTYINLYIIRDDFLLTKIAFIKEGDLFTL